MLEETERVPEISFKNTKHIANQLVNIYRKLGEKEEKLNHEKKALRYYEKCLNACSKSSNKQLEASITMKVSAIYIKMGMYAFARGKINDFKSLTQGNPFSVHK